MDKIDFAINNKWNETENELLNEQKWEDFENNVANTSVVIYGIGNGAEWFFIRNKDNYDISMVIDGNDSIVGDYAGEHIYEMRQYDKYKDIIINSPKYLFKEKDNNSLIVISSLMHYQEIADYLDRQGFHNYFAVLPMETNYRKKHGITEQPDWMNRYVEEVVDSPVQRDKIVFTSGVDYSGNGRAIADSIFKLGYKVDLVWIVRESNRDIPNYIRRVSYGERRQVVYEMETAGILIDDNCSLPQWFNKRNEQIYIQVKHWGSLLLKVVSRDEGVFRGDKQQIAMHERDGKMMDYVITGSDLDTKACCSGFAFDKEVWQIGSPRSDVLFHPNEVVSSIKRKYSISDSKKVLLYAPTFRYTELKPEATFINLDYAMVKEAMEKRFGGEWLIFLRLHPAVARESKNIIHPEYVIDVSDYSEGTELVAASDAMVTDYSSIMFEAALIYKPVFLYVPDREDYVARQRALHMTFDELPFSVAETNSEIIRCIHEFDKEKYAVEVKAFMQKYNVCDDGHASERAAKRIIDLIEKSE